MSAPSFANFLPAALSGRYAWLCACPAGFLTWCREQGHMSDAELRGLFEYICRCANGGALPAPPGGGGVAPTPNTPAPVRPGPIRPVPPRPGPGAGGDDPPDPPVRPCIDALTEFACTRLGITALRGIALMLSRSGRSTKVQGVTTPQPAAFGTGYGPVPLMADDMVRSLAALLRLIADRCEEDPIEAANTMATRAGAVCDHIAAMKRLAPTNTWVMGLLSVVTPLSAIFAKCCNRSDTAPVAYLATDCPPGFEQAYATGLATAGTLQNLSLGNFAVVVEDARRAWQTERPGTVELDMITELDDLIWAVYELLPIADRTDDDRSARYALNAALVGYVANYYSFWSAQLPPGQLWEFIQYAPACYGGAAEPSPVVVV